MSRDYSSRRNAPPAKGKRKSPPRKAAARSAPKKRAPSAGPPGWVWMLCGLCIGLTVAAGFYVFGRPAGTPMREQVSIATPQNAAREDAESKNAQQDAEAAEPAAKEEEPRFSFYKMLPNYEVVIPEEEYPDRTSSSSSHSSSSSSPAGEPPPPPTAASKPQPTTPKVEEPGNYIIQAGSFSTFGDADRRKAELALLGLTAQIVDVKLGSGKTVYRVQSNTITSSSHLNDVLARLRENRIDTLVMRAKN